MAQDEVAETESHRSGYRRRRRRKSAKRKKLIANLKWILGGIAVGLPVLAFLIYVVSNI